MSNLLEPAAGFAALDAAPQELIPLMDGRLRGYASAHNLAAVFLSAHYRAMGWRGWHHLALSFVAINGRLATLELLDQPELDSSRAGDILLAEAKAWPDDLEEICQWLPAWLRVLGGGEPTALVMHRKFCAMVAVAKAYMLFVEGMMRIRTRKSALSFKESAKELAGEMAGCVSLLPEVRPLFTRMASLVIAAMEADEYVSLAKAWEVYQELSIPAAVAMEPAPATGPEETKARRLAANRSMQLAPPGHLAGAVEGAIKHIMKDHPQPGTYPLLKEIGALQLLRGDSTQVRLVTFMTPEAYEELTATGVYQSLWERGSGWHNRFSDCPERVRAAMERRVFGERGDRTCYGYLTTNMRWLERVSESGVRQYGQVRVMWHRPILSHCTCTVEDSMKAGRLFDPTDRPLLAYLAIMCALRTRDDWTDHPFMDRLREICGVAPDDGARYIEFQCHRPLRACDIAEVTYFGKDEA